jgi:response regulator NasT
MPIKVMLAEDDMPIAKGFSIILQDAGYEVVGIASDGFEAVDMARELVPDVIVMDIKMPKQDGLSAAKAINSSTAHRIIPIIIVTAYAEQKFVERARNCGIMGYLVKPVGIDDLVPAIEIAHATGNRINALDGVISNLSEELETRKIVEQAKGLLMKHLSISEDDAMKMMQKESQRQRIRMRELANAIIVSYKNNL